MSFAAARFLHILCGSMWLGGSVGLNVVILPAIDALPVQQQRAIGRRLMRAHERLAIPAAFLAVILGIIRATVFGPLGSFAAIFRSAYGVTAAVSVLVALSVFVVGGTIAAPAGHSIYGPWDTGES